MERREKGSGDRWRGFSMSDAFEKCGLWLRTYPSPAWPFDAQGTVVTLAYSETFHLLETISVQPEMLAISHPLTTGSARTTRIF